MNRIQLRIALLSSVMLPCSLLFAEVKESKVVPEPSAMKADVIVHGRTVTLKDVEIIKYTGPDVPKTFAENKFKNLPGYTMYVSKHYVFRSDIDEVKSVDYLTMLELAYPLHIWIVGAEPAEIDSKRIPVSYSKSMEELIDATKADLQGTGWGGGGGGVTLNANGVAYNYPSGGLTYHLRDLVMHEALHAIEMAYVGGAASKPMRFVEGITYGSCNYVFDEEKNQLTMMVMDKPAANNIFDNGRRDMGEKGKTITDFMEGRVSGSEQAILMQFFWNDPERIMKWRVMRDEFYRLQLSGLELKKADSNLITQLFGSVEKLNDEWQKWLKQRHNSFHYFTWGYEQDADTVWSYGFGDFRYSWTEIFYPPKNKLNDDPLRMDWPAKPKSHLVGPVELGSAEPTVGCVADFTLSKGAGVAGIGIGADYKTNQVCAVLINNEKELMIDGGDYKIGKKTFPLNADIINAAKANGNKYGMTVTIGSSALNITVKAGSPAEIKSQEFSLPISAEARDILMTRNLAYLSKGGRHGITVYIDDNRKPPTEDLSTPAGPGRFAYDGDEKLYQLYYLAFKLGDQAPKSLTSLRDKMLASMYKGKEEQKQSVALYEKEYPSVMKEIMDIAKKGRSSDAICAFTGIKSYFKLNKESSWSKPQAFAEVWGAREEEITGTVDFEFDSPGLAPVKQTKEFTIPKGKKKIRIVFEPEFKSDGTIPFSFKYNANIKWNGMPLSFNAQHKPNMAIPCYWVIGPFRNEGPNGGGVVDIKHQPEIDNFDVTKAYDKTVKTIDGWSPITVGSFPIIWGKAVSDPDLYLGREKYLNMMALYGAQGGSNNLAAYALTYIDSPTDRDAKLMLGSEDGIKVWLNDQTVHTNLVHRDYASQSDTVPIKLKQGKNKLVFKITRGQWGSGWGTCAYIMAADGSSMDDLKYSLDISPTK